MKILFVSNVSSERCGVAEYGRTAVDALRKIGLDVTEWDGHYPAIYEKPYLPADANAYDVIHFNWHPVTLNHYHPGHLPQKPLISVFFHDLPPWSDCPIGNEAHVKFCSEAVDGYIHLPYPAYEGATLNGFSLVPPVIGWTGVRGDGRAAIEEVCQKRGWILNAGDPETFLRTPQEIRRLSKSTLNVLWYSASGRGQSLALMTAAASKRPLLINNSTMFASARGYEKEIYRAAHHPPVPYLEQAIDHVLSNIYQGTAVTPTTFLRDYSWTRAAEKMADQWAGVISCI